jgi:rfaE bifunctional protein kinase chain/domain
VAVVGDVMLDRYYWGKVSRISPEAPVPVVEVERTTVRLGGAANVAANIGALEARAELLGVVGDDPAADVLRAELREAGIPDEGLIGLPGRPTTEKIRVIAHGQQVVRADFETAEPVAESARDSLLEAARAATDRVGAVLLSDYGKGTVTGDLVAGLVDLGRRKNLQLVVDPKEDHFPLYRGVTVLTPNLAEAETCLGSRIRSERDLLEAGPRILERLACGAVLITRGEKGMSLFEAGGEHTEFPAVAREVYDVTGAGDTVAAVLAVGLAAGLGMREATELANHAASLVVAEVGTAKVTRDRLIASFEGAP